MIPPYPILKAITLHQVWSQLVAIEAKKNETRSWKTDYRGPLAIHAGKNTDWLDLAQESAFRKALLDAKWEVGDAEYKRVYFPKNGQDGEVQQRLFPLGAIVAVCELVACFQIPPLPRRFTLPTGGLNIILPPDPPELHFGDYKAGRFAWVLHNIKKLPVPIPCRGYQQLWTVPRGTVAEIYEQIGNQAPATRSSQLAFPL